MTEPSRKIGFSRDQKWRYEEWWDPGWHGVIICVACGESYDMGKRFNPAEHQCRGAGETSRS